MPGGTGAAQNAPDPSQQLARFEGLCHVVVRTELQPDNLVYVVALAGQDNQREIGAGAQGAGERETVLAAGKSQIEYDEVVSTFLQNAPHGPAGRRSVHGEAFRRQKPFEHSAQHRVIVDDEDMRRLGVRLRLRVP